MRSRPYSFYQCFGCIHVRSASLALFTSHLIVNMVAMILLTYLVAVNFHHRQTQLSALGPTQTEKSFIRQVVRVEVADVNDTDDTEDVLLSKSTLNVNVTKFISVFVIVPGEKAAFNQSQLLYSVLYASLNGLTALLAVVGVLKGAPSLIVPFLVGHVLDIIFSTIYISGFDIYGYDSAAFHKLRGLIQDEEKEYDHWYENVHIWALVAAVLIILVKLYFIRIFCLTMLFIREEKARIVRDTRQHKWMHNILQGQLLVENVPPQPVNPPPTYTQAEADESPEQPPEYSA